MEKLLTGKEIVKKLDIDESRLFRYVQLGLPVYDNNYKQITSYDFFDNPEKHTKSVDEIEKDFSSAIGGLLSSAQKIMSTRTLPVPEPQFREPTDEKRAFSILLRLWFDIEEVRQFIHDRGKI